MRARGLPGIGGSCDKHLLPLHLVGTPVLHLLMWVMSPDFSALKAISRVRKDEDIDNDVDFQLLRHPCIVSKNPSADSGHVSKVRKHFTQFLSVMTITMVKLVC